MVQGQQSCTPSRIGYVSGRQVIANSPPNASITLGMLFAIISWSEHGT